MHPAALELVFLDNLSCDGYQGLIQLASPRYVLQQEITLIIQGLFLCSDSEQGVCSSSCSVSSVQVLQLVGEFPSLYWYRKWRSCTWVVQTGLCRSCQVTRDETGLQDVTSQVHTSTEKSPIYSREGLRQCETGLVHCQGAHTLLVIWRVVLLCPVLWNCEVEEPTETDSELVPVLIPVASTRLVQLLCDPP